MGNNLGIQIRCEIESDLTGQRRKCCKFTFINESVLKTFYLLLFIDLLIVYVYAVLYRIYLGLSL